MKQSPRLIIVDDDDDMCETLTDIFLSQGYEVSSSRTGEEALTLCQERTFDVALVDIKLPDMEGTELLSALKVLHPHLEVVLMTGHASLESAVTAVRHDAFAYVTKPFEVHEVIITVDEAVERQQARVREIEDREHYRSLSIIDGLTELCNYRCFYEHLGLEVERAKRYSHTLTLLMVDVDDFKGYNDSYGHQAGDEALKYIAHTLRQRCRGVDVVARYGGEEFAILLVETAKGDAAVVAERLRQTVAEGRPERGRRQLTVSIGVATLPEDAQEGEELVARADEALYKAKGCKNRVCLFSAGNSDGSMVLSLF
ncbi:MAG: diguanylate cyclase [Chloroflexi bacterium]|nr:diguanylate cyclase [Chloroflexota bacterium]